MTGRVSREAEAQLEALFREMAAELYGRAYTLSRRDHTKAEDLVQAAFEAAAQSWDKLSRFDQERRRQWMYTVLRNKAIDERRVSGRTPACIDDFDVDSGADTVDHALASIALMRCWAILERMPPTRFWVAYLHWRQQWTTAEIAECLGVKPVTVRGHLKKARDEIISKVGPDVPFPLVDQENSRTIEARRGKAS